MGTWDTYENRINARGGNKHDASKKLEQGMLLKKVPDTLSYHNVMIDDEPREAAIINSDNLNIKHIISRPDETINGGSMVFWKDNHWLVTEKDANDTVYTKATMKQCNHLLKWVSKDGTIHEQWCVIEDGTKLKYTRRVYNSLAYWKRYVKTIPLIAGNPLELYRPQHNHETWVGVTA